MKILILTISSIMLSLLLSSSALATYLVLPANTATIDEYYDSCTVNYDGTVTGTSTCSLYFPIRIETGKTLSTITAYYYDNSGSQSMTVYFYKETQSSDANTLLDYTTDISTSASIQSSSISYGSSLSSSYAYFLMVVLGNGTELRGIKLYYY